MNVLRKNIQALWFRLVYGIEDNVQSQFLMNFGMNYDGWQGLYMLVLRCRGGINLTNIVMTLDNRELDGWVGMLIGKRGVLPWR